MDLLRWWRRFVCIQYFGLSIGLTLVNRLSWVTLSRGLRGEIGSGLRSGVASGGENHTSELRGIGVRGYQDEVEWRTVQQ